MGFSFYGKEYDVRLSSFPTIHGETFVLRLLVRDCPFTFERLGYRPSEQAAVKRMLAKPGLVLITGPTGCGKSTTLACFLLMLATRSRHIVTIEDPVEYIVSGTDQLSLPTDGKLRFAGVRVLGMNFYIRNDVSGGQRREPEAGDKSQGQKSGTEVREKS